MKNNRHTYYHKSLIILLLIVISFPSFSQHERVGRELKDTDTCQCLAASFRLKNISGFYNKWMVLDAFNCIEKEWLILNPYTNKIYVPNGAHSKVSVVDFVAREALQLDATEYNWISFPRTTNHPSQESISVVENNIQPFQNVTWSEISNLPFGGNAGTDELEMEYVYPDGWNTDGNLKDIHNVRGHKIQFERDELEERLLFLHGTVIDPYSSKVDKLHADKENWTGYWLYQPQNAFDALADALDQGGRLAVQLGQGGEHLDLLAARVENEDLAPDARVATAMYAANLAEEVLGDPARALGLLSPLVASGLATLEVCLRVERLGRAASDPQAVRAALLAGARLAPDPS
ncbi:MAG: hypothetical protein L3J31_05700, partial [Bacteroidales bacterium]|nr:hypothetical protein [Bacteroidales bacterium]